MKRANHQLPLAGEFSHVNPTSVSIQPSKGFDPTFPKRCAAPVDLSVELHEGNCRPSTTRAKGTPSEAIKPRRNRVERTQQFDKSSNSRVQYLPERTANSTGPTEVRLRADPRIWITTEFTES
jgi:hypothetical protein